MLFWCTTKCQPIRAAQYPTGDMMPSQLHISEQFVALVKALVAKSGDLYLHPGRLGDMLQDTYGLYVLGTGASSVVVKHPLNDALVVKISTIKHDGSLDYLAYVMQQQFNGQKSKHWPEVHSFLQDGEYTVVVMERLHPASEVNTDKTDYAGDRWVRDIFSGKYQGIDPAFDRTWRDLGLPNDLHGRNYMIRTVDEEDYEFVITDPFFARGAGWFRYEQIMVNRTLKLQVIREPDPRPVVASASEGVTVPRKKEDKVLWHWPVNANKPRTERVRSPLLPVIGSRRVHPARAAQLEPIAAADFGRIERRILAWGEEVQRQFLLDPRLMRGRRADLVVLDDVAPAKRDIGRAMEPVRVQAPFAKRAGDLADLQAELAGGLGRQSDGRIKAEVFGKIQMGV